MNWYRPNNVHSTGSRKNSVFLAVTFLILALAALDFFSGGTMRVTFRATLAPVATIAAGAAEAILSNDTWRSRARILAENESLRAERAHTQEERALFEALHAENESLRALLNLASGKKGVAASVQSSFHASPYGTFLIGGGEREGIEKDTIVLSEGGFALGRVAEVSSHNALVQMAFAPGAMLDVVVDDVGFSLEGRSLGNARAEVPKEARLTVGDAVFAPVLGNQPVGVIGSIESASSSAYAEVFVYLPVNLNTLRFVYVVEN